MENNNNHTFAWQFFGCGSLVAFVVMVVLYYNQLNTVSSQHGIIMSQRSELQIASGFVNTLTHENDSLYASNDSLYRANKILKLNLPQETNIRNAGTVNIGN